MSILEFNKEQNVTIVSHKKFLEGLYSNLDMSWETLDIFNIRSPFRMDQEAENVANVMEAGTLVGKKRKKRKLCMENSLQKEILHLKEKLNIFHTLKPTHFPIGPTAEEVRQNNQILRRNVKFLLNSVTSSELTVIAPAKGQNTSNVCVNQGGVWLPPRSGFRTMDVQHIEQLTSSYDVILMDPPWGNKHVKRVKRAGMGYDMMNNRDLEMMPVGKLLSVDGLVFVWCTNKMQHRSAVVDCFNRWGVTMVGTWYWVKVTKYGELVTQFSQDKQPYEVVLVGQKSSGNGFKKMIDGLVFFSVPSGVHSHKPPLSDVIQAVVDNQMDKPWEMLDKLEVFGRYLLPGWLTVGNQPTMFNSSLGIHEQH